MHPLTQNDSIGGDKVGKHNSRYVADAREEILSISITTDSANKHSTMTVHVIGIQAFAAFLLSSLLLCHCWCGIFGMRDGLSI